MTKIKHLQVLMIIVMLIIIILDLISYFVADKPVNSIITSINNLELSMIMLTLIILQAMKINKQS